MADEIICSKCGSPNPPDTVFCGKCGTRVETNANDAKPDPLIGAFVGDRFLVHEKLGEGGMGVVYRAEQTAIQREVALKVLHSNLTQDESLYARFQNEAAASSRLNHPNTITIYDFGKTGENSLYIAMEFIQGDSLDDEIRNHGAMDVDRACHIAIQICGSLQDAHDHAIVHRDLKPENVMLCERGGDQDVVKVLDFGIAKILEDDGTDQRKALTKTGMVFGTPQYMSPEQIRGEKVDNRSDIYSLGVILYQMLAGTLPFTADTPMGLLTKHLMDEPPPVSGASISEEIQSILMSTLAKDPGERPQSMKDLSERLSRAIGLSTGQIRHMGFQDTATLPQTIPENISAAQNTVTSTTQPKGKKPPIALVLIAIILLGGGGAAAWYFAAGSGAVRQAAAPTAVVTAPPQNPAALPQAGAQPVAAPGVQAGAQPQAATPAPLPFSPGTQTPEAPSSPPPTATGNTNKTPAKNTKVPGKPATDNPQAGDPVKPPPADTVTKEPEEPPPEDPPATGPKQDVACKFGGGKAALAKSIQKSLRKKEALFKACTKDGESIEVVYTFEVKKDGNKVTGVERKAGTENGCVKKLLASSDAKNGTKDDKVGVATISLSRTNKVMDKCRVLVKILPKIKIPGGVVK